MIRVSEYVSLGHPDKIADYISQWLLDRYIEKDPDTRYAVEVQIKGWHVTLGGEVSSKYEMTAEEIRSHVRDAVNDIGYTREYMEKWGSENTICGDLLDIHIHQPAVPRHRAGRGRKQRLGRPRHISRHGDLYSQDLRNAGRPHHSQAAMLPTVQKRTRRTGHQDAGSRRGRAALQGHSGYPAARRHTRRQGQAVYPLTAARQVQTHSQRHGTLREARINSRLRHYWAQARGGLLRRQLHHRRRLPMDERRNKSRPHAQPRSPSACQELRSPKQVRRVRFPRLLHRKTGGRSAHQGQGG